jgi:cobalamin biosynthesis protein CobT
VALLLALGVAACGGGDDSDSTANETAGQQSQADNDASQGGDQGNDGGSGDSGSSTDNSDAGEGQSGDRAASDFTPRKHSDSGGGAEQFKVKNGDNSVQEFGAEGDTSEFDAAAEAFHNFLDARAEANWEAVCGYISETIVESLEKLAAKAKTIEDESCGGILAKLVNPAAKETMKTEAEEADVRSLRTDGDRAFLLYTDSDGSVFSMPMANEDGAWKVASIAGYPLS